jgi:FixJ family two-component response regulator
VTAAIVHIVDDDASVRTALGRLLRARGYDTKAYASAWEFLTAERAASPACVVLDVSMPGPSGLDLHDSLIRSESTLPVIFLTGHGDIPMTVRAMRNGAVDFLTKPVQRELLLAAIERALSRGAEERAAQEHRQLVHDRYRTLTSRERAVFARVAEGRLNKQIAAELGTSERTVKAHRAQVMDKMRTGSVAELVRAADLLKASQAA